MDVTIRPGGTLRGTLRMPADKAIGHRVALVAALTDGAVACGPWPEAEDCRRTLELVRRLGARVRVQGDRVRIAGAGLYGLRPPRAALDCGESGTTMRLACGLLAGQPFAARLSADGSLRSRPMRRIAEPLGRMGACISGRRAGGELCPPLVVRGRWPLRALTYRLPVASAQVKSAVLLAGLFADGPTTIIEPAPTRDHTERALRASGATVRRSGQRVTVVPPRRALRLPQRLAIPGDPSSAAFFIVAASLVPGSRLRLVDVGLNPTRTMFLRILRRMGASICVQQARGAWEPQGTLLICHRPLRGTVVTAQETAAAIDEIPILMVAAAAARGRTVFRGVGELRVKESDRLAVMAAGLSAMGVRLSIRRGADVRIDGGLLQGAELDGAGDHRMAMSFAVAALAARGATRLRGAECVAKSFGSFFSLLGRCAGRTVVECC